MIEKLKICLVGATGVGKTSLMSRFVRSIFSEQYRTTIGVSIERRDVQRRSGGTARLVLWDLSGEDEFQNVQLAYLRGAAGYILVIDGTRPETIDTAYSLKARADGNIGTVPFIVAINKADLADIWAVRQNDKDRLERTGWPAVLTSAKTGAGVEEIFNRLVDVIFRERQRGWM
jgi:small GTP-binding protein